MEDQKIHRTLFFRAYSANFKGSLGSFSLSLPSSALTRLVSPSQVRPSEMTLIPQATAQSIDRMSC